MGKRHAPSLMRQIRRELKEGASPESIFPKVKSIEDPYYRSLSFYLLIPYFSPKDKKCKESISLSNKDIEKVQQPWRRVELIGSISKILKSVSDTRLQRQLFSSILEKIKIEKSKEIKDFLLKYTKHFPEFYLSHLLDLSKKGLEKRDILNNCSNSLIWQPIHQRGMKQTRRNCHHSNSLFCKFACSR